MALDTIRSDGLTPGFNTGHLRHNTNDQEDDIPQKSVFPNPKSHSDKVRASDTENESSNKIVSLLFCII